LFFDNIKNKQKTLRFQRKHSNEANLSTHTSWCSKAAEHVDPYSNFNHTVGYSRSSILFSILHLYSLPSLEKIFEVLRFFQYNFCYISGLTT